MSRYHYYVIVTLKTKYDNGIHKRRTLKITAASENGALYQAINQIILSNEGPAISLRVDWLNPMPAKKPYKKKPKKKERPNWKYDGLTRIY